MILAIYVENKTKYKNFPFQQRYLFRPITTIQPVDYHVWFSSYQRLKFVQILQAARTFTVAIPPQIKQTNDGVGLKLLLKGVKYKNARGTHITWRCSGLWVNSITQSDVKIRFAPNNIVNLLF